MGKTAGQLADELSPEEFCEWVAFYSLEQKAMDQQQMANRAQQNQMAAKRSL